MYSVQQKQMDQVQKKQQQQKTGLLSCLLAFAFNFGLHFNRNKWKKKKKRKEFQTILRCSIVYKLYLRSLFRMPWTLAEA